MADKYQNFAELKQAETDFRIEHTAVQGASWLVAAIQGGNIENGTTLIAHAVSRSASQSFYSFCGANEPQSGDLHLTRQLFDEPLVLCTAPEHTHLLCVNRVLAKQGAGTWAIIGGAYEKAAQLLGKCLSGMIEIRD